MPSTVATANVPHNHHSSPRTRLVAAPVGHTTSTTAATPTTSTRATKATNRTMPNTTPTAGLPDSLASALAREAALGTPFAVPTLNTKAPWTGCESAEMTRHATT